MKYIALFFIMFFFIICGYSQSVEQVYKQVIEEFVLSYPNSKVEQNKATTLIVRNQPVYLKTMSSNDYARLRGKYKKLKSVTFMDFVSNNQQGAELDTTAVENIKIKGVEIVVFKRIAELDIKGIHSRYPNWNLFFLEFSNIGLDSNGKQAMVYYGFDSGPGVGAGIYIIYKKKKRKWKRKKIIAAWSA
jgi:hypothetical protein